MALFAPKAFILSIVIILPIFTLSFCGFHCSKMFIIHTNITFFARLRQISSGKWRFQDE